MLQLLTLPVMLYAGYEDMKYRIIPDKVHILLILIGLINLSLLKQCSVFYIPVSERMAGLLPAAVLFLLYIIGKDVGGGDLKIIISAGFCVGFQGIMLILAISCIGGLLYCQIKKERSIPLAAFMAAGTVVNFISAYF